jgi:hypothetical protein
MSWTGCSQKYGGTLANLPTYWQGVSPRRQRRLALAQRVRRINLEHPWWDGESQAAVVQAERLGFVFPISSLYDFLMHAFGYGFGVGTGSFS